MTDDEIVSIRHMVEDVDMSIAFYTNLLGFELVTEASPAFADLKRGNLRIHLAGPRSLGDVPRSTPVHRASATGVGSSSSSRTSTPMSHGPATLAQTSRATS
jgi:catechol 2,3-dioxygenase-like lactoylglutathione lyase family enzyme